jgi:hypothetical protein
VQIYTKGLKLWNAFTIFFFYLTLWRRSSHIADGRPLRSSLWTFVLPSLNIVHDCLTISPLLHIGHKGRVYNSRWIFAALIFVAWKKDNAWILQLLKFSIARHNITQCMETSTNTRWPVIWWLTRRWVMWQYSEWASFPLLHHLPNINESFFRIYIVARKYVNGLSDNILKIMKRNIRCGLFHQMRYRLVTISYSLFMFSNTILNWDSHAIPLLNGSGTYRYNVIN